MNNSTINISDKKWYAIKTKYKCEKYVAQCLAAKGIDHYLPLLATTKHYASRKKTYIKPLINCYVFARLSSNDFCKVLQTEYVYGFLTLGGQKAIVREEEVQMMKRIVGEVDNVKVLQEDLVVGDTVEIISGNLTGLQGVLAESKGKNNFIVNLTSMGMALTMTINRQHLSYMQKAVV